MDTKPPDAIKEAGVGCDLRKQSKRIPSSTGKRGYFDGIRQIADKTSDDVSLVGIQKLIRGFDEVVTAILE